MFVKSYGNVKNVFEKYKTIYEKSTENLRIILRCLKTEKPIGNVKLSLKVDHWKLQKELEKIKN